MTDCELEVSRQYLCLFGNFCCCFGCLLIYLFLNPFKGICNYITLHYIFRASLHVTDLPSYHVHITYHISIQLSFHYCITFLHIQVYILHYIILHVHPIPGVLGGVGRGIGYITLHYVTLHYVRTPNTWGIGWGGEGV